MNTNVIIKANKETGAVLKMTPMLDGLTGEMKEMGTLRVEQTSFYTRKGFIITNKRSAFVKLSIDQIEAFGGSLVHNGVFPIPGKISIYETLTPYVNKSTGKIQEPKRRSKDGEIVTYKGQNVYMNSEFTHDLSTPDVFLREHKAEVTESYEYAPE